MQAANQNEALLYQMKEGKVSPGPSSYVAAFDPDTDLPLSPKKNFQKKKTALGKSERICVFDGMYRGYDGKATNAQF